MVVRFVPEFLTHEEERLRRKKRDAQELSKAIESFRASASVLKTATANAMECFGFSTRKQLAANWSLTNVERNIAFDSMNVLVPAPKRSASEREEENPTQLDAAASANASESDTDGEDGNVWHDGGPDSWDQQ